MPGSRDYLEISISRRLMMNYFRINICQDPEIVKLLPQGLEIMRLSRDPDFLPRDPDILSRDPDFLSRDLEIKIFEKKSSMS